MDGDHRLMTFGAAMGQVLKSIFTPILHPSSLAKNMSSLSSQKHLKFLVKTSSHFSFASLTMWQYKFLISATSHANVKFLTFQFYLVDL